MKRRYDLIILLIIVVILTILKAILPFNVMSNLIAYFNLIALILIASMSIMIAEHLRNFRYRLNHHYITLSWKLIAISALALAFLELLSYLTTKEDIFLEGLKFLMFCIWLDAYWLFYKGVKARK